MSILGVGLPEMGLVAIIALILIGPQRFPEIARQAGRWYRTARAFTDAVMVDVRSAVKEIEEEVGADQLRKEFQDEDGKVRPIRELQDLQRDLNTVIDEASEAERGLKADLDESDTQARAADSASTTSTADDSTPDGQASSATGDGTETAAERQAGG